MSSHLIPLYKNWHKAYFVKRPNRFVVELILDGKPIRAWVPNTGRMAEFCFEGHPFYVTKVPMPKFQYKIIGTEYQAELVFLDTIRVNHVVQLLIENHAIPELSDFVALRREATYGNSRFDFEMTHGDGNQSLIEVKSCTLCHNGMAMFPDAPTDRGRKHLAHLEQLAAEKCNVYNLFLITTMQAQVFLTNYHVDLAYAQKMLAAKNIAFLAYKIGFDDPITLNISKTKPVEIDLKSTKRNAVDKGSYVLVLQNDTDFSKQIGLLGEVFFKKGYYVYVGSAMNILDARISRHYRSRKKVHWHLDYVTPKPMKIIKSYPIRSSVPLEQEIVKCISNIADGFIKSFGASDSKERSHLLYFKDNPIHNQNFYNVIMNFRHISKL
ncbi:MAG: DNA/RNA nuclease SfsA [Candidatus Cloacimonetes bacterium]|nr:DNA/RNA nuclease SfsA [Candidatus Cloacimonadota bacterium]